MAFVHYFREFIKELKLDNESIFTTDDVYTWFGKSRPEVQRKYILPQLLKKTTNHQDRLIPGKYEPDASPVDDLFFSIDPPAFSQFQLYQEEIHDPPYYPDTIVHERELQEILIEDPAQIEQSLRLIGSNYPAGRRFIDLLCLDRNQNLVVIELKVSRAYDRVVGQLLFYMAWIKKHRAEANQTVRGIIVANKIIPDLILALSLVANVECLEFDKSTRQLRSI
jgi:hypothetical protein